MRVNNSDTKQWFAIYVKSRSEKKTWQNLTQKGIETYLPVQKKLRQWSDRKKLVEMPLLPGYLFVHITRKEYDATLQTDHVICYVTLNGKASPVREEEINTLKQLLQQEEIQVELTREDLEPGQQVEVIAGPLMGMKGELIRLKGKKMVGIRIQQIQYTISVEVPIDQLAIIR